MSVFKDDQIVAKVLGGKSQPKPKSNSKKILIAGLAAAALAVTAWAVAARHGAVPANASSQAAAADEIKNPDSAALVKAEVAAPIFSAAAPSPSAGAGDAPARKKFLPPVIEEFHIESVELHPKYAVKLVETKTVPVTSAEPAEHKPADASATTNVAGNANDMCAEGKRLEDAARGNPAQLERARAMYQKALESGSLKGAVETQCVERLNERTAKFILYPKTQWTEPKAEFHKVESGEVVDKIARKYKVTQGQIKRLNHLNDKLAVRIGQSLKILPGETVFKVDKEKLTGTLYIDGVFIKRYPVGIGPGNATPKGSYTVENKVLNPDWYYDGKKIPYGDAKNILGTRWMGMANSVTGANGAGLGVHGTAIPESVPGRESKGCVRMHNEDVEELYDFMPQGGKVVIE